MTRLYTPVDSDNPYISMHIITKFQHPAIVNTMKFNMSQTGDDRNSFTFDLVWTTTTVSFVTSGSSFASDAAYPIFTLPFNTFNEYILSIALLNSSTNHSSTDASQKKVHFRASLGEARGLSTGQAT
jgi:hypothetical protein